MGLRQEVDLAPVTLFFGPNSAGKSTVSRALRFLAQSNAMGNELLFSGRLVDLKTFEATVFGQGTGEINLGLEVVKDRLGVVHRHPFGSVISLDWKIKSASHELPAFVRISFSESESKSELNNRLPLTIEFDVDPTGSATLTKFDVAQSQIEFEERDGWVGRLDSKELEDISRSLEFSLGMDDKNRPRSPFIPHLRNPLAQSDSSAVRLVNSVLRSADDTLSSNLRTLSYLGPLRFIASEAVNQVRIAGPMETDASNIQSVMAGMSDSDFDQLSHWLFNLTEGGYKLTRVPLSADIPQSAKKVQTFLKDLTTSTLVAFDDAGVGLAQVLPVLVQVFGHSRGPTGRGVMQSGPGTVYVEQPELHLHPKMQSALADFCLENSEDPGDSRGRLPRIICETHSEQLLIRIQRRIREGKFPPNKVAVYFVDRFPGTKSSYIQRLRISEMGEFMDEWPLSFSSLRLADFLDG